MKKICVINCLDKGNNIDYLSNISDFPVKKVFFEFVSLDFNYINSVVSIVNDECKEGYNQFVINAPKNITHFLSITLSFIFYTKEINIVIINDYLQDAIEWIEKRDSGVGVALRNHYYNAFSLLPIPHSSRSYQKDNFHKSIPESVRGVFNDIGDFSEKENIVFLESQLDLKEVQNKKNKIFIIDAYQDGNTSLKEDEIVNLTKTNDVFICGLNPEKGIPENMSYLMNEGVVCVSIFNKYQLYVYLKIVYSYSLSKEKISSYIDLIKFNY